MSLRKGGVIYYKKHPDSNNKLKMKLDNVKFINNYAQDSGAGLYYESDNFNLEFNNIDVKSNTGKFSNSFAEIIGTSRHKETLKITNCRFSNNLALKGDSLLTLKGMSTTILDSVFSDNAAVGISNALRFVNTERAPNMYVLMERNKFSNDGNPKRSGSFIHGGV